MREKLRSFFHTEGAKMKGMTIQEKWGYIWEYYKIHIIAVMAFILLVCYAINTIWINPPKKEYLEIAFYGDSADLEGLLNFEDRLGLAIIPAEQQKQYEVLAENFAVNSSDAQLNMASTQKFAAMVSIGELDLMVVNDDYLGDAVAQGMLMPLSQALDPDTLASLKSKNKILSASDYYRNSGDYAIKLDNNALLASTGLAAQNQCIGVIVNTKRMDILQKALSYILSYN